MPFPFLDPLLGDRMLRVVDWAVLAVVLLSVGLGLIAFLLRARNNLVAARWNRLEAKWKLAVLEALEGSRPLADLQRSILSGEAPYFLDFLTRFARRLRGVERERVSELARPFLSAVRARLGSRSPEIRAKAVDTLGLLAWKESTSELVAALDDPSLLVAMNAARALTRDRSAEFAEQLVAHLHRFQHWRQGLIAAMLAALGPDVARSLRLALGDRKETTRVRVVAAEALARLNDPAAGDVAAAVAEQDADPELLAASLRLLARVGRQGHIEAVRRLMSVPDEIVRMAAVQALAALAGPSDVPLLLDALADPSPWVANHAARGLARGEGRTALQTIARGDSPRAIVAREALTEGQR